MLQTSCLMQKAFEGMAVSRLIIREISSTGNRTCVDEAACITAGRPHESWHLKMSISILMLYASALVTSWYRVTSTSTATLECMQAA